MVYDNDDDGKERWKKDCFTAIRNIFEKFNDNCGEGLQMGKFCACDECQYGTRIQIGDRDQDLQSLKSQQAWATIQVS